MKKQIIAAAVAVAVAAPAMAQVAISGRVGATYDNFKNAPLNGRGQNQATIGDNNSRVIFGITEDLGGGLRFNGQIDIRGATDDGGRAAGETRNSNGNTFAAVSGGLGRILIGQHDMLYNEVLGFGTSSDVLDGVNIHRRTLFTSNRDVTGAAAPIQITGGRVTNLIRYDTPTFGGGFNATFGYSTNPNADERTSNTEATDREDDGSASMAFLRYASGPLRVTLGYYNEKRDVAAAVKPSDTFTLAAGSYVAGPWEFGLNFTTATHKSGVDGARELSRDAFSIPVNYNMGATTLHAGYTEVGSVSRSRNTGAAQWMVGATHSLSKRTLLGAGYSVLSNGNNARYQMLGTVEAGAEADGVGGMIGAAGGDGTYYGFGIRHNF